MSLIVFLFTLSLNREGGFILEGIMIENELKKLKMNLIKSIINLVTAIVGIVLCLVWFDWKLMIVVIFITGHNSGIVSRISYFVKLWNIRLKKFNKRLCN